MKNPLESVSGTIIIGLMPAAVLMLSLAGGLGRRAALGL